MEDKLINTLTGFFSVSMFLFFVFNWGRIVVVRKIIKELGGVIDDEIYDDFYGLLSSIRSLYYIVRINPLEKAFVQYQKGKLMLVSKLFSVLTLISLVGVVLSFFVVMVAMYVRDYL